MTLKRTSTRASVNSLSRGYRLVPGRECRSMADIHGLITDAGISVPPIFTGQHGRENG
jgi:hypothetical protein